MGGRPGDECDVPRLRRPCRRAHRAGPGGGRVDALVCTFSANARSCVNAVAQGGRFRYSATERSLAFGQAITEANAVDSPAVHNYYQLPFHVPY